MAYYDCFLLDYRVGNFEKMNTSIQRHGYDIEVKKAFSGAIAYLVTYMWRRNISCDYVTNLEDNYEILEAKSKKNTYGCVGISTTFCNSIADIKHCVDVVKKVLPGIPIIIGGAYIAKYIKENQSNERHLRIILKSLGADFLINSFEGEYALYKLVLAIKGKSNYDDIKNLCYIHNGHIVFNEIECEDNDLSKNPVNWNLFSNDLGNLITIRTAVSCPFSCSYCSYPINAGKYRYISVDEVEKELNTLENNEKIEHVFFVDDTFNIPPKRFKDILRMLIRRKFNFRWHSYIRCQFIDEEDVRLMKASGCEGVLLGIESGSQAILNNMNKNVKIEEIKRGLKLLKDAEIVTVGMFIVGFPGETNETIEETIRFINSYPTTFYMVQPWYYDPRTPIGEQSELYNIQGKYNQWSHNTMNSEKAGAAVKRIISLVDNSFFCVSSESLFQLLKQVKKNEYKDISKIMLEQL